MYQITQFKPVLYALLLLGMLGFALAATSPLALVLGCGGVAINGWLVLTGRFRPMPRPVANLITIGSMLVVARQLIHLRDGRYAANDPMGNPVLIIGHFLVVLQLVKVWEQRVNRDYGQLLVLGLLQMVAASINTNQLVFGAVLFAYLLLSLYGCLLFHLKVEGDKAQARADEVRAWPIKARSAQAKAARRGFAQTAGAHLTRLQLELGSTNPAVVRSDADVELTARSLFDGMTKLNGQWCEAPRAVFADTAVHARLADALAGLVEGAELGSSRLEDTRIGPMAYAGRRRELRAQRDELLVTGRRLVAATPEPDAGWFVGPTVVEGAGPDLAGEVFGPLLTLEPTSGDEESVARANTVAGGLAAYVFGEDIDAALTVGRRLVGGEVKVNGTSLLDLSERSAQSFFGGSGIGGHGDRDVLDFHSGKQVVGRDLVGAPL